MLRENLSINITPGGVPVVIHISQYDIGLRTFVFTPYTTEGTFTADTAASATLEGTKPDGNAFVHNCSYNSSTGVITYTVQDQLAAVAGKVWSKLVIRNTSGNAIGYAAIIWVVDMAGVQDGAIMSDSDISALQEFVNEFGTINAYKSVLDSAVEQVNANSTELDALDSRMDTFARLPDGSLSTSADAELVDIRVKADGTTAATAGDAVRQQVTQLNNNFINFTGAKLLKYTAGYIDCSGTTVDITNIHSSANYTHVVDACAHGDVYIVNGTGALSARQWCFVDANGNVLSVSDAHVLTSDMEQVIAPQNSAYFVSNFRNTSVNPFTFKLVDSVLQKEQAIIANYAYAKSIANGTDFNNITTAGNYKVISVASANTMINIPEAQGGRLTVMTTNASASIAQIYQASGGNIYWRVYSAGTWVAWSTTASREWIRNRTIATAYHIGTAIPSNSDLNDYQAAGNYYIASGAVAETISNLPSSQAGRLTVMTINAAASIAQIYQTSGGMIYWRVYSAGTWVAWSTTASREWVGNQIGVPVTTGYNKAVAIPSNSDLDDYRTAGNYYITSGSVAETISHVPEAVSGRLTILTLSSDASVHQWYIAASNNWYIRELISGAWSAWKHFVDADSIEPYIQATNVNGSASKGAYNALQAVIKNAEYDIAFANAFTPLSLKNYLGNTQNVHPKVLYFANGFGGHNYWMAYTPYPYSRDGYENPCIAYSDDGIAWTNIAGNPLDNPNGYGYNSDTHLVYRESDNTLECWYRYVGDESQSVREETIYRQTTTDGINWTAKELIYSNTSGNYARLLSPAVLIDNNKYCIWVVNSNKINYYEAPLNDVTNWSLIREYTISFTDGGTSVSPWHIDVIKDGNTYVILVMCRNTTDIATAKCSLFVTTSSDNVTYNTPAKVVGGADNWDRYMYRSSIVKIGSKYRIYYSAGSGGTSTIYNNAVWGIGITESDSLTTGYYGKYE